MAFPTSPNDGDEYTNALGTVYKYLATDDKWYILSVTAGNFLHNELDGIDDGDINHLTDAQIAALHAQLTNLNELATRLHSDLQNKNAETNVKHLTDAQLAALHTRLHAITDILDHSANNHKVFYSDGSGHIIELALGADGEVLTSTGANTAPAFEAAGAGGVDFTFDDTALWHWAEAGGSVANLTVDGGWHDLDVSAKCAANETAVFQIYIFDAAALGFSISVREDGATNSYYIIYVLTVGRSTLMTVILNVGATQIIEYKITNGADRGRIQYMGSL